MDSLAGLDDEIDPQIAGILALHTAKVAAEEAAAAAAALAGGDSDDEDPDGSGNVGDNDGDKEKKEGATALTTFATATLAAIYAIAF